VHKIRNLSLRVGMAAAVAWSAGCVPISDYRKLEKRFVEQEQYVVAHLKDMRERERREQVLTLRAREQERQIDLLRARLKKSERLRNRIAARLKTASLEASTPREAPPQPAQVMGLEVNQDTGGLVLENSVMFAAGKATLKASGRRVLSGLVKELKSSDYKGKRIRVDGHTDATPIKRSKHKSNWDLSGKRALAVLHYLEKAGVPSDRLSFAGFGAEKPMDTTKSKRALAKNRRVELVILD
jgi:flagellar motor protein MotB